RSALANGLMIGLAVAISCTSTGCKTTSSLTHGISRVPGFGFLSREKDPVLSSSEPVASYPPPSSKTQPEPLTTSLSSSSDNPATANPTYSHGTPAYPQTPHGSVAKNDTGTSSSPNYQVGPYQSSAPPSDSLARTNYNQSNRRNDYAREATYDDGQRDNSYVASAGSGSRWSDSRTSDSDTSSSNNNNGYNDNYSSDNYSQPSSGNSRYSNNDNEPAGNYDGSRYGDSANMPPTNGGGASLPPYGQGGRYGTDNHSPKGYGQGPDSYGQEPRPYSTDSNNNDDGSDDRSSRYGEPGGYRTSGAGGYDGGYNSQYDTQYDRGDYRQQSSRSDAASDRNYSDGGYQAPAYRDTLADNVDGIATQAGYLEPLEDSPSSIANASYAEIAQERNQSPKSWRPGSTSDLDDYETVRR
ncbi:MAG: hypothetical protein KDA60_22325, partial [Planctomycetales bacterium]|nr:hypothetical protein [Planctomycetales bacterium]